MRGFSRLMIVIASVVLIPTAASAQSIAGVVKDTSGAVLPGVTVEAASPALLEKMRSVVTDGSGQYRIENLRPGAYTVTFTLAGFNTVKRDGIELIGSFTATVNADLRVGAIEETITVTGEASIVDVQNTTRQRVLNHDVIDAIPSGRSERNVALLVPGISLSGGVAGQGQQDVGGALNDTQGSLLAHGSRSGDHRITQNGVSLATANGGGQNSSQSANLTAYQEVTVDSAAVSAELAQGGPRINYIPRDGGNTFKGVVFGNFANDSMQGSNYTQELKSRGLDTPGSIEKLYDINPGLGGPFKKDLLWFFGTVRYNIADNRPTGILANLNANKPDVWTYAADPNSRPFNHIVFQDAQLRLTWQATPKNKIGIAWDVQNTCLCSGTINATTAPEAALIRKFPREYNILGDWTAPLTNRLLLEGAMVRRVEYVTRTIPPGTNPAMIAVTDQALGNLAYRGIAAASLSDILYESLYIRAAASYITGTHAFKVGFTLGTISQDQVVVGRTQPVSYRFNNGIPNQITLQATPNGFIFNADQDSGVYVQDKWTLARLTASHGVRFDYFTDSFPEQTLGPGPLVPNRNLTFAATRGISWKDITPKSGLSYDVFGNGKTALKVTLNKYLAGQGAGGDFGSALGPISRVVLSTTRSWNDNFFAAGDPRRGNYVPDCDLTNTVANGECGAMANPNFGKAVPGSTYDPETLTGWGKRVHNWEFSAGVQHEVMPRVSVDVSYFRRWYGNFFVTDDRAVSASDFTTFSLTAPTSDSRLPTADRVITGLYDLAPAKFGVPADNYITFADNYGKQIEHWNGVDVTVNARPRAGVLVQGGMSGGRTVTDNCEVAAKVPESLRSGSTWTPLEYCHQQTRFLTQVKMLGVYTVPKVDMQVSGTFQSVPGPASAANYAAPNAVVAPSLGRNLSGNAANLQVNLLAPGTLYGERASWLDFRVGKVLRYGRTRTAVNFDLFNSLNANPVLGQNSTFGGATPWLAPQSILIARFFKISAQFDF